MAKFEIVELLGDGYRTVVEAGTFDKGVDAAVYAERLRLENPSAKFQPRIIKEEVNWVERELSRFASNEYEGLPWSEELPLIEKHFAHRAKKNPENIAFTPDDDYGHADRKVSIHVNTYLNRYYPDLSIEERRRWVRVFTKYDATQYLRFATSADEIEQVYLRGPGSCMAHSAEDFASSNHPVTRYYGNGLTLAYLDKNGDFTARAVVHTERKIWARIYGDEEELSEALQSLGYRRGLFGVDWRGVEMDTYWEEGVWDPSEEEETSGYICPYIDFSHRANIDEERGKLIFGLTGDIHVQSTNGLAYEGSYEWICPSCKRSVCSNEVSGPDGTYICMDCADDKYGHCEETGTVLNELNQGVICEDGAKVLPHQSVICTVSGKRYRMSKCVVHGHKYCTPDELKAIMKGMAA